MQRDKKACNCSCLVVRQSLGSVYFALQKPVTIAVDGRLSRIKCSSCSVARFGQMSSPQ